MDRRFALWLGAAVLSQTGDGVLLFALAWTATGIGPGFTGLVFTVGLLPPVALLLVGGAVADRTGLRVTMVACSVLMVLLLAAFVLADVLRAPLAPTLLALTLTTGAVGAFSRPAAGGLPRLFVAPEDLSRALATSGGVLQVARLAGPPLGGVVVGLAAVRGAALVDLVTFAVVVAVLLAVRPAYEPEPGPRTGSTWRSVVDGLAAVRTVPGAGALLAAVALLAGALVPMLTVVVPLAGRERGWTAGQTGLVEAAWITGSIGVSLVVARRGTRRDPRGPLLVGPLVALLGVAGLAVGTWLPVALVGAVVMGIGTAVFTAHVFPLYVLATPPGMLARFQSLLALVQLAPMAVTNLLLAAVASAAGAVAAYTLVALLCGGCAVVSLGARRGVVQGRIEA